METKKVLGIIFSILFICIFAFVLTWGIINFNKVKDGMSGTELYTQSDLNKAYEDGYNNALKDKDEYDNLINSYRDTITNQSDQISQLNSEVLRLTNNNKDYQNQIINLESQIENLNLQINNLNEIKKNNEKTINELNIEITKYKQQIIDLTNTNGNYLEQIRQLEKQVSTLQKLNEQLQKTNELNVETINNLNLQIISLNSQVSELTLQIQNNSTNVSALNNKISELEKSVAYYEQYIASLEGGEQIVITFEFDGSVYNIQVIAKNSKAIVNNPTSTRYVIFNFWTVDGSQISLDDYTFSKNTKVVADVSYKYDVKFSVDGNVEETQLIDKGSYATKPTDPHKDNYDFDGWTLNGVDVVDVINTQINENTTFIAKFTKLHTVTFKYENEIKSTQQVRNGEYASAPLDIENTEYKIFNGWKLNDVLTDISSYKIFSDTTFVADITYKYDVKFMVDDRLHNSQIVESGKFASVPSAPSKDNCEFNGWTINGVDIIDVTNYAINESTTFIAKFTKYYTVTFINGIVGENLTTTQSVKEGMYATAPEELKGDYINEFLGWYISNREIIDVSTYEIHSDVTFNALYKYKPYGKFHLVMGNKNITYNVDWKLYGSYGNNPSHNASIFTSTSSYSSIDFNDAYYDMRLDQKYDFSSGMSDGQRYFTCFFTISYKGVKLCTIDLYLLYDEYTDSWTLDPEVELYINNGKDENGITVGFDFISFYRYDTTTFGDF